MSVGHVWLVWALGVVIVELEAVRRGHASAERSSPLPTPPSVDLGAMRVLVVRPCAGAAPWLATSLASLATCAHTSRLTCRLAVATTDDTAASVAEAAALSLRSDGLDAAVVVTGARGPNRKAAQLAAVVGGTEYDAVIVADSDVDLAGVDLDALLAPLARGVAAVWAPPVDAGAEAGLGDRASSAILDGSLHAFPLLARLERGGFVGKLFAIRADALARAGGFSGLVAHLGEDLELARRLRAAGERVEVAPFVARSIATGRSWSDVTARFARWMLVIRAQRPLLLASYPGLFFATLPLLIAAPLARGLAWTTVALASAAVLLARVAVSWVAGARSGRRWRLGGALVEVILAEVLLASAFARAIASRRVVWCGVELTVDRAGRLVPL